MPNEFTKTTTGGMDTLYTYDDWGRMVTKSMQSGAHLATYTYRYGDKLTQYVSNFPDEETDLSTRHVDGFGRRRIAYDQKGAVTKTTWWRYAGWSPISEHTESPDPSFWDIGARTQTYVPGLAQIPGANPSTGAYQYFQTDHLGSIRSVRAQDKSLLASYEYTPYGQPFHFSGPTPTFGYTGHMWDSTMAMYWAPYRYYMPGNARWHMRDPIGGKGVDNLYAYVDAMPIDSVDPLGLCREDGESYFSCVKRRRREAAEHPTGGFDPKDTANDIFMGVGGASAAGAVTGYFFPTLSQAIGPLMMPGPGGLLGPASFTTVEVSTAPWAAAAFGAGYVIGDNFVKPWTNAMVECAFPCTFR